MRAWLYAAVMFVIAAAVYAATLRPGQDWGGDFAQYVQHARNLATGRPYLETKFEHALADATNHMPASYPPVFPALLAPVYATWGLNYTALKLVPQLMFLLAALALFALFREMRATPLRAAFAAGTVPLSGLVLATKDQVLSDSTYLFFATLALLAMIRMRPSAQVRSALLVALLVILAYASRAIGISLVSAVLLYGLWRDRKSWIYTSIVVALFGVALAILTVTLYDSRAYQSQFPIDIRAYLRNVAFYLREPASIWGGLPTVLRYLMVGVSLPLFAWEYVRRLRTNPTVVECYVITATLPVIVYSSGYSARYLLPVIPFFVFYFVEAASRLRWGQHAVCGALAIGAIFNVANMEKGPYREGVDMPEFQQLVAWVRSNTPPDAMIVSWNPRVLTLYTDRPSAWYPQSPNQVEGYLKQIHASYALIYKAVEEDHTLLRPAASAPPVFRNAAFELLPLR